MISEQLSTLSPLPLEDRPRVRSLRPVEQASVVTPIRPAGPAADLGSRLLLAFATAADVASGLTQVVAMLRRAGGAGRAEWWRPADDGRSLGLAAAEGGGRGRRTACSLGPVGALVVTGDRCALELASVLPRLAPMVRRRWTDEQLAERAVRLARRNEALEDFAGLVAHELRTPLLAALRGGDPATEVERALELVDSVLQATRIEVEPAGSAPLSECLADALRDVGPLSAEVAADLPHAVPVPRAALRLVLRNLVANASRAGAKRISVASAATPEGWALTVDDDGVGLAAASGYAGGSGLGLCLCRRVVERFGGSLELVPRASGGTRAIVALPGAA